MPLCARNPLVLLLALVVGVVVGTPSGASAARLGVGDTVAKARQIRAEVDAEHPELRVTEASSTAVVESFTLFEDAPDPRVVPAGDGIYYAVCPNRATCPYPGRRARAASAFAPRRVALELAVRTFLETDADLVVVSLPTSKFVLFIVERWEVDAARLAEALAAPQAETSLRLKSAVDTTTLCRLYWGVALEALPSGRDSVVAVRLDLGRRDVTRAAAAAPSEARVA